MSRWEMFWSGPLAEIELANAAEYSVQSGQGGRRRREALADVAAREATELAARHYEAASRSRVALRAGWW
jgi:hypothetical protein